MLNIKIVYITPVLSVTKFGEYSILELNLPKKHFRWEIKTNTTRAKPIFDKTLLLYLA